MIKKENTHLIFFCGE